jgi:predicted TIM-barrel fold metal-dependent hydrolase
MNPHGRSPRRQFLQLGLGFLTGVVGARQTTTAAEAAAPAPPRKTPVKRRNPAERAAWLAQVKEEVIEPELPICDPHHHFSDGRERYAAEDFLDDAAGHKVVETVFLDCQFSYWRDGPAEMRPVGETERVEAIAALCASNPKCRTSVAAAIVSHANLRLGAKVLPVLEAHVAASPTRFRGIRHACPWHADKELGPFYMNQPPGLLQDAGFRSGLTYLQRLGLTFDAVVLMTQLDELASMAQAFPELTIVCNHLGVIIGIGPYAGKRDETFAQWKRGIQMLAACPNVVMKLGGVGMRLGGFGWHERPVPPNSSELAEAGAPYYLTCIEAFGVDRCMFESNFPVDKDSFSYRVLWNSFKKVARGFSAAEKAHLFRDTAVRVYRIGQKVRS